MTTTIPQLEYRLLTEYELADRQRRSVKTIRNERVKGSTIPFIKIGRLVRYRLADVEAWEQSNQFGSTSEYQSASNNSGAKIHASATGGNVG